MRMSMIKFTEKELQTLVGALESALLNESEYLAAHTNRYTGESINPNVTKVTKTFIKRIGKLKRKVLTELKERKNKNVV